MINCLITKLGIHSMANIQWIIILTTLIISCIALICSIVSIATDSWVIANAILTDGFKSDINYGLFSGSLDRHQLATVLSFDLSVTCDFSEGACIYSCQKDGTRRQDELIRIIRGDKLLPCDQVRSIEFVQYKSNFETKLTKADDPSEQYIPAGLWLCTVLFLVVSIIFTTAATLFALLNLNMSPVEPIFNVFGLYIWNCTAAICALLAISLWGGLFDNYLKWNIAITDTLRRYLTFSSIGLANIGFSFYMLLVACILNFINVVLLFIRKYTIQRQNLPTTLTISKNDAPLEYY